MAAAVSDKQSQFLMLYNQAQPLLRGFLLAWFRDFHRAEDLLQQTSLELWEHFGEYDQARPFNAWAMGIARNQALKELRRLKTSSNFVRPELLEAVAATSVAMALELENRRWALSDCLEKLSSEWRRLLGLYYGKALSIAEVALASGRPRGSVEVALWRIRQKLADCTRKKLKKEEIE